MYVAGKVGTRTQPDISRSDKNPLSFRVSHKGGMSRLSESVELEGLCGRIEGEVLSGSERTYADAVEISKCPATASDERGRPSYCLLVQRVILAHDGSKSEMNAVRTSGDVSQLHAYVPTMDANRRSSVSSKLRTRCQYCEGLLSI